MRLIDADALYKELNDIGGCDAEKNTYAAGWDDAISNAIELLQDEPTILSSPNNINKNEMLQIIDHYGAQAQENIAIEEMAELTKALLKLRRCTGLNESADCTAAIVEEISDVMTTVQELILIYNCENEVLQIQTEKLNRQIERMKAGA